MKHAYAYAWARPLLATLFLFAGFGARAQQAWRPFRPGLIYSFGTSSSSVTYLLRLDSAYATAGGDSVWAFNRLLRLANGSVLTRYAYGQGRPSRNNLFGARLRWQPGTSAFVLENVAEGSAQAALALRLLPRAAVGSTWAASAAPVLTATLRSRGWQPISSVSGSPFDTVAVIALSSGQELRLSRQYGLLAGPRWLETTGTVPQWEVAQPPVPLASSAVSPLALFNLQPGDQLGYSETPWSVGGPLCVTTHTLRLILTRRQTGDSLLYTYRQQARVINSAPCGASGSVLSPVRTGRLAFSLQTGKSPQFPALLLLSGEYRRFNNNSTSQGVAVGLGLELYGGAASCPAGGSALLYQGMYPFTTSGGTQYSNVTDGNWYQTFAPQTGLGDVRTDETYLQYFAPANPGGPRPPCGSPMDFVNLLPTRAAQAAAIATLAPNPATETATLTLAQPARPGTTLHLTDALGRSVWRAPVAAGQTAVAVPLAGQPDGLYLLHLSGPEGTAASWKLHHE